MSEGFLKGVSRVSHVYFRCIAMVFLGFQGYFKGLSRLSQGYLKGASRVSQECLKGLKDESRVSQGPI